MSEHKDDLEDVIRDAIELCEARCLDDDNDAEQVVLTVTEAVRLALRTEANGRRICVDFDGVIHSYTSGWQGADVANDKPVPGALEWLCRLLDAGFAVCIYSSRSSQPGGIECMRNYLIRWGLHDRVMSELHFPIAKPAANMTVDDRAFRFEGDFPSVEWLERFRPWNKLETRSK